MSILKRERELLDRLARALGEGQGIDPARSALRKFYAEVL